MKIKKLIRSIFIWLPSVMVSIVFIQNALRKIFQSDQQDKIITSNTAIIIVGIILLVATILFLINKTIIWGTTVLALYMTCIVFIHMFKGKPFEIVSLIVLATIFAAYLRKPELFHLNYKL